MTIKRVITAGLIILSLVIIVNYLPPIYFLIMGLFWLIFGTLEFYRIAEKNGHKTFKIIGIMLSVLVFCSFYFKWLALEAMLILSIILISFLAIFSMKKTTQILATIAISLIGILYIGFLLGFQINIRLLPNAKYSPTGLLFYLYAVVGSQDAGGFISGSFFGKHNIFSRISPKKTLEGTIGSFVFGLAASLIARTFLLPQLAWKHALILPFILGVFGLLGDLCESALKRGGNLKDSSAILPGHGGVLDRIDSILFCAPIFYYYYLIFISKEIF